MIVSIILLITGLTLIVLGANYLVEGASGIARRFGLSEFIIGLTIVGMGTSAPEMVVSFIGAIQGNADIAIGNVVGSNIMNTLLVLGLTALILPVAVTPANRRRDIPVNIGVTVLVILLGLKHTLFGLGVADGLGRIDGGILLTVFLLYIGWSLRKKKQDLQNGYPAAGEPVRIVRFLLMALGGLAALIVGGNLFVDNATLLAKELGVSDKFIAITILAGGTSLPELATCVAAAAKGKQQMALGNIIGSNIFNLLLILGGSAVIAPLSFEHVGFVDLGVLLASSLCLVTALRVARRNVVDRVDGFLYLLIWAGYMAYLAINL